MAGGTGITPMLQIIAAVMREGSRLEMSLIFANKSEDDILLRNMIESLVSKYVRRRSVTGKRPAVSGVKPIVTH